MQQHSHGKHDVGARYFFRFAVLRGTSGALLPNVFVPGWHVGPAAQWCAFEQIFGESEVASAGACSVAHLSVPHVEAPMSICLHPEGEWLSDQVREAGEIPEDCVDLLDVWRAEAAREESGRTQKPAGHMDKPLFVDVGANVGPCSFSLLVSDEDAIVILLEPLIDNAWVIFTQLG